MYAGNSVLGLQFSEKLKSLSGKRIRIRGFMAPPLKAEAAFLILTKEPVRLIEVTGRLETGSETDPETGFVSLVRLADAKYEVI